MLCLPCLGTGRYPGERTCPRCGGRGDLPDDRLHNPMCPYCIGKGRDPFHRGKLCSACDGWGRLPRTEERTYSAHEVAADLDRPEPMAPDLESSDLPYASHAPPAPDGLEALLRGLVGDVEVCDPTLDAEFLDRLRLLRRCDLVRVLAHDVDDEVVPRIREFTRELPRFLFRRYAGREIHDRFVLAASEIVFLGPDARDRDGRTPTLIRVPMDVAREMLEDVRMGFNRRWSAGERLG